MWEAENGQRFKAQLASHDGHVAVYGYGQQLAYLNQTVAQAGIQFSPSVQKQCSETYASFKITKPSIAVHVRRGSSVSYATSIEYFESAIAVLQSRLKGAAIDSYCFVIGTDDKPWVEKMLIPMLSSRGAACIHFKPETPALDMCVLTLCDHAILSSGTFSFMSGFLKRNRPV
jgi:hypothetical protein